jgi:hypothetical protein
VLTRRAAPGVAVRVAARPIRLEALPAAAAAARTRMTRAEAVLSACRLTDREVGRLARSWRLSFSARELGANERPVDRSFLFLWRFGFPVLE